MTEDRIYRLPPAASEPEFHGLLQYWQSKFPREAAPGWLPGRQHIDPAEIPPRQLAQLLLLDVVPAQSDRRFRFRVAGTGFTTLAGRDVTGLHYDEIGTPERVAAAVQALNLICDHAAPVFAEGRLTLETQDYFWVKRLGLPLAQDGRHVDMVLALWVAEKRSFRDVSQVDLRNPDGTAPQLLERV